MITSKRNIICPFCKSNLQRAENALVYSCQCNNTSLDFSESQLSLDPLFGDESIRYHLLYNYNTEYTYLSEYTDAFVKSFHKIFSNLQQIYSQNINTTTSQPITLTPVTPLDNSKPYKPYWMETFKIIKIPFCLENKSIEQIQEKIDQVLRRKNIL